MKQKISKLVLLISCSLLVYGCDSGDYSELKKLDPIDRDANLQREDFLKMRDAGNLNEPEIKAALGNIVEPPIPDLAEILAAPPKPQIGETQLVSLSVTDDVPLKDVLMELARLSDVDMDIDSGISGGVTLRAKDRPFNEIIERISDMANLRYNMKNGVLRVERDIPYIKTYSLDLLNSERSATGSISTGSIGSSASSSSGSSGGNSGSGSSGGTSGTSSGSGSSSNITATSESDFWGKFENSIAQILAYSPTSRTSESAPASTPTPSTGGSSASGSSNTFYVVNKQASTLTVSASEKQHETIAKFLDKIVANTSSQVLIEAKIVEVNLSDSYQSGINWTNFGSTSMSFSSNLASGVSPVTSIGTPTLTLLKNDILRTGVDLSAAVKLLNEFGTTRALSSPRLNAVNNQQAVLSFVEQIPYFQVDLESTPSTTTGTVTTPGTVTATSTRLTEPVGIILNLQPSINTETSEITLSVRPTLKRLVKFVDDPGYKINLALATQTSGLPDDVLRELADTTSPIPQIETKELDSIVKVKSGQTLVIGGLLEDRITNTDAGVPYASEVPLLGNIFKFTDKQNNKKELVIFIRATIIGSSGSADSYDKAVYEKFIQDPRPLKF